MPLASFSLSLFSMGRTPNRLNLIYALHHKCEGIMGCRGRSIYRETRDKDGKRYGRKGWRERERDSRVGEEDWVARDTDRRISRAERI